MVARLVATGYQGPDLQDGIVDTSGCVSLRSTYLQVISLSAIKNGTYGIWISRARCFERADSPGRSFFRRPWNGNRYVVTELGNLWRQA